MKTGNVQDMLVDVGYIAEIARVSKRTIRRWSVCGRLPGSVRIGGSLRWRKSDIDLWIELGCPLQQDFEARKGGYGLPEGGSR